MVAKIYKQKKKTYSAGTLKGFSSCSHTKYSRDQNSSLFFKYLNLSMGGVSSTDGSVMPTGPPPNNQPARFPISNGMRERYEEGITIS